MLLSEVGRHGLCLPQRGMGATSRGWTSPADAPHSLKHSLDTHSGDIGKPWQRASGTASPGTHAEHLCQRMLHGRGGALVL